MSLPLLPDHVFLRVLRVISQLQHSLPSRETETFQNHQVLAPFSLTVLPSIYLSPFAFYYKQREETKKHPHHLGISSARSTSSLGTCMAQLSSMAQGLLQAAFKVLARAIVSSEGLTKEDTFPLTQLLTGFSSLWFVGLRISVHLWLVATRCCLSCGFPLMDSSQYGSFIRASQMSKRESALEQDTSSAGK